MSTLETLGGSRHISLTTFRRDGTPVATPVWVARDGGELVVWTKAGTGKVKRLRNDPRVRVAVCNARGRITEGAVSAEGTARLLDDAGTDAVRALVGRKYAAMRAFDAFRKLLRRPRTPQVGIAVTLRTD
jgi:PPOX class probable F420-dependent enzyme